MRFVEDVLRKILEYIVLAVFKLFEITERLRGRET